MLAALLRLTPEGKLWVQTPDDSLGVFIHFGFKS